MKAWRDTFGQAQSRSQLAGWLLAFAFPVLALVVDKSASTIFAIFFLAGLWLLVRGRHERPDAAMRWVLMAFAAYFLVGVASFFLADEQTRLGEKLLGRDIRFFGAAVTWVAIARLALPERLLALAFALGGMVTGGFALIEVLLTASAEYRAGGETISIVFGHLSVMLFAVNLAMAMPGGSHRKLALAGMLFALAAAVLSGTRGALLSALVVMMAAAALFWQSRDRRSARFIVTGAAAIIFTIALAGYALGPRLQEGWQEFHAYRASQDRDAAGAAGAAGCVARDEVLGEFLRSGEAVRLDAGLVKAHDLPSDCHGSTAILLANDGTRSGRWTSGYRSVAEGMPGRVLAKGRGKLKLLGGDRWTFVRNSRFAPVDIAQAQDVGLTQFQVIVPPGGQLVLLPVAMTAGEYAFAGKNSSVGRRLSMWDAALRHADEEVFTGHGPGAWPLLMAEEARAGRVAWQLTSYDHAHSDYLTVLVERGLPGVLTLLAVLLAPPLVARRLGNTGFRARAAIILVAAATATSALTETVFNHSIGITYYCVLALLLMAVRPEKAPELPTKISHT